jgi:hypothetical protein
MKIMESMLVCVVMNNDVDEANALSYLEEPH